MPADLALYENILKTLYPQDSVPELIYPDSPLVALVKKDENWDGDEYAVSNRYTASAGFSHSFPNANNNKTAPNWARFRVTDTQDYAVFSVPGRVMRATRNDRGALVRALKAGGDAAFYKMNRRLSSEIYGNGGGARARIDSGQGTATLTLANIDDVKNFEVGDVLVSAADDGTGAGPVSANTGVIGSIDRTAGTLTIDPTSGATWHADFDDDDYLFIEGDYGQGLAGLEGWIPAAAPTSGDDWFGVDRSVDPTRQAGIRHTTSANNMRGALLDFARVLMRNGAKPSHYLLPPEAWTALITELQANSVTYDKLVAQGPKGDIAEIGFKAVDFMTAHGMVKLLPDNDCPPDTVFALKLDTWTLASRGALPHWDMDDNQRMVREGNADAITGRIKWYGNLVCDAPGQNGRCNVATAY